MVAAEPRWEADDMVLDLIAVVSGGLAAGLLGALMGLGGGIVAVPFLNLVMGVPMHCAAAAGLISTLSVSCGAAGRHLRQGSLVNIDLALQIELFAAAGGLFGGIAAGWMAGPALQLLFALALIYGCIHTVRSARRSGDPDGPAGEVPSWRKLISFPLGLVAGVMSGLLGIGGGIVMVPVLHLLMALPFKSSIATSNFMMGLTALPALSGFVARGQLDLFIAVPLAAGVLLGANLGSRLLPRIRTGLLKMIFAGLLLITAVEMARKGFTAW